MKSSRGNIIWIFALFVFVILFVVLRPSQMEVGSGGDDDTHVGVLPTITPAPTISVTSVKKNIFAAPHAADEEVNTNDKSSSSSTSSCVSLPMSKNATGIFQVELCHEDLARVCKGYLKIQRVKGCRGTPGRPLSRNATLSKWIETKYGPDSYRVRITGPEVFIAEAIFSSSDSDRSSCTYTSKYNLRYMGTYNIAIELLYDNYYAIDEVTNHWPPLRKLSLLQFPESTSFHWYHKSQVTPESTVTVSCSKNSRSESHEETSIGTAPTCRTYKDMNDGRWVRDPKKGPLTTRVRVKKIRRQPILFQWELQKEAYHFWKPYRCSLPSFPTECLKNKRMIIGGDSQLRALYFTMLNVLRGHGVECVQNVTSKDDESPKCVPNVKGSQHHKVDSLNLQFDFADDHYISKLSKYSGGYDIIVVGYAQHPASKEHWPLDRYRREIPDKAHYFHDLQRKGKTVIWYAAPQYPHSTSGYPIVVMDWRTDLRLQVMNEFSESVMSSKGIPVVDSYKVSTGFSHTSPDQAHYHNWVIYDIINVVLNNACGV
eukprot:PhF_6_TR656/c0_g1_i1/m.952